VIFQKNMNHFFINE